MRTIDADQGISNLAELLDELKNGEEILIVRGQEPVARLIPIVRGLRHPRPKIGELRAAAFSTSDRTCAPLSDYELNEWGL